MELGDKLNNIVFEDAATLEAIERVLPLCEAVFQEARKAILNVDSFYGNLRWRLGQDIGDTELDIVLDYLGKNGVLVYEGKNVSYGLRVSN